MLLSKFWVKGYGTFKANTSFDMNHKGITTIFGLNKDAGGTSYTNASGKSLLFTSIPEIGFGNPPSGKDQTKHKDTEIGLEFKSDTSVLEFIKTYGKSKKFKVTKNGRDLEVRKLDYAEKKLQTLLGGSEEDFYTTRYIDNTIPHPLIVGKAAVRQDFFVSMFNLENVDAIRHLLLAELREAQKASSTYKEVKALFEDLKDKAIKPSEVEEKQNRIAIYKTRQERLLEQINKYQVVRDLIRFEKQNVELINSFKATTSLANFDSEMFNIKQMLKAIKAKKEDAQVWDTYTRLRQNYVKTSKPLLDKIKSLIGEDYDKAKVKERAAKFKLVDAEYATLKLTFKELDLDKPKEPAYPEKSSKRATIDIYDLTSELDNAKAFKDGKCPTCGAPHKSRDVKVIRKELDEAKYQLRIAETYDKYVEELSTFKKNKKRKLEIQPQLKKLKTKLIKLEANSKAYDLLKTLPSKPQKPEGEFIDLVELETKLERYTNKKAKYERFETIIEQLRALDELTKEQREKARELDTFTDDLGRISNKINNLTAEVTAGREATKQLKALATRGKVLKVQAQDEPILKTLIDAYSKKGLKKLLIQRYAALLEQQVNKFVRLFFAEDIQFEFVYNTKLDFWAHRKKGKKTITTDVKRLSGAEKRMLTLVLVVASISLLPKSKRSNFLILDEPEANMGPEAVATFVRALPVLNKVIPHIIVITPRPELEIEGSRIYTVVKKGGTSTLVKGKIK